MRRLLFALLLALGVVGLLAAPATAKGPVETATGQVVITGPGLNEPVELTGTVQGFAEPGETKFVPIEPGSAGEFGALLASSALLTGYGPFEGQDAGYYVLPPKDLRSIGPAYEIRLKMTGRDWTLTQARQLYPFAPDGPLVFVPNESLGQTRGVRMNAKGLWWSAPPELLAILHSHGLPRTAPSLAEPPPGGTAPVAPDHSPGLVVLWTGLAFLGLVVAGVLAARRRLRVA